MQTRLDAYLIAALIGLVIGGSQALSRSLFSQMIPKGLETSFFSLYELSDRGVAWLGPLIFGIVANLTNSYRQALLSLIVFFIVGIVVLYLVNTEKAIFSAASAIRSS
jgi:UMF1 family MFS transporter